MEDGVRKECPVGFVPASISAVDIGSETAACYINNSHTVFVDGPMGIFEQTPSDLGSKAVFKALGETKFYVILPVSFGEIVEFDGNMRK